MDPRYCNITWSKMVWICYLWKTPKTVHCVLQHGEMAWPCFLNGTWSEKVWQTQVWKPLCFVSHLAAVLSMIVFYVAFRYALESCWAGSLNGHKYPVTSFIGFHWELVLEDTRLLIPHRGEAHSYCMLKSRIWHEEKQNLAWKILAHSYRMLKSRIQHEKY